MADQNVQSATPLAVNHPWRAGVARLPYMRVARARLDFASEEERAALTKVAHSLAWPSGYGDINTSHLRFTSDDEGARRKKLIRRVTAGLRSTGVLGTRLADYAKAAMERLDVLVCNGAPYHNDTYGPWRGTLFWVVCLDAKDVEFHMPDTGVRLALTPGDMLVFDPCLVHALCRSGDGGRAIEASFQTGVAESDAQTFLAGELPLSGRRWATLGSPWRKHSDFAGYLELDSAEFNESTGALLKADRL